MTTEQEIKKAIVQRLKNAKFTVPASETQEGFDKPAAFVTVYPSEVTRINTDLVQVTDSVEIRYYPKAETTEECAEIAQKIRRLFIPSTLDVSDRHFAIETINMEIENKILYVFFELDYTDAIEYDENSGEYETAEELNLKGV